MPLEQLNIPNARTVASATPATFFKILFIVFSLKIFFIALSPQSQWEKDFSIPLRFNRKDKFKTTKGTDLRNAEVCPLCKFSTIVYLLSVYSSPRELRTEN